MLRSIPPVVPTECDVLIVCRQCNDKEWKLKEQHAKMWENIAGAKRYSRPRGFNIAGRAPPSPPPAGDVSHKPGGRLSLLSARPAVTPATLKRAATNFAAR